MAGTNLRLTPGTMTRAIISGFSDIGYTFSNLTESRHAYFVRVLNGLTGGSFSRLTTAPDRVLALILTNLGTSASELTMGHAELLGGIYDHLPFSGGSVDHLELEDGSGVWLWEDGTAIGWD